MDRQFKNMFTIAVITMLVLLYAEHVSASCYVDCLGNCFSKPGDPYICLIKCAFKCGKIVETQNGVANGFLSCAQFGTDVGKVEDCVNKYEASQIMGRN
ncbi:hypothetical protein CASFOL_026000 [Castilleja foliolosa]|uniref:Plant thionin family protein n=1 Tax=Castilleja foliolosa TaxID=1961234 RepID=A0ABD3CUL4_9LAMI